jgi:type IV secretion system protein VirD4
MLVAFLPLFAYIFSSARPPAPPRHFSNVFGAARFATDAELKAMRTGLELGLHDGDEIRVSVEGTLLSIAPPRKGKTGGLLIPNLLYPQVGAWTGPAIVIDPKGEVYEAVSERRRKLGRQVRCLDPLNICKGIDLFNPLKEANEKDVLYFQHIAGCLLPQAHGSSSEAAAYFRNRAIDLVTAAILATCYNETKSVVEVARLLTNEPELVAILRTINKEREEPAVRSALDIFDADPKTRDPIKSTALQAFQWLADDRMRAVVSDSTFDLAELTTGTCDLFVAVPPEYKALLAPWIRWLLADIFATVRHKKVQKRIVAFVDEAAALGRFDEILTAAAELPGHGLSLWTFWQNRSQIVDLYGEAGAATIVNTAECVTISDLGAVDPDECARWSKAIGNYTALVETTSRPATGSGQTQISGSPQCAPLMGMEELSSLPSTDLLAFVNSRSYTRHPLRLTKTLAHANSRFRRFLNKPRPPVTTN